MLLIVTLDGDWTNPIGNVGLTSNDDEPHAGLSLFFTVTVNFWVPSLKAFPDFETVIPGFLREQDDPVTPFKPIETVTPFWDALTVVIDIPFWLSTKVLPTVRGASSNVSVSGTVSIRSVFVDSE